MYLFCSTWFVLYLLFTSSLIYCQCSGSASAYFIVEQLVSKPHLARSPIRAINPQSCPVYRWLTPASSIASLSISFTIFSASVSLLESTTRSPRQFCSLKFPDAGGPSRWIVPYYGLPFCSEMGLGGETEKDGICRSPSFDVQEIARCAS